MHVCKISGTRGIAHTSNYYNDIFTGSSFNRKTTKAIKKETQEFSEGFVLNEFGVLEETDCYDRRQIASITGRNCEQDKDGKQLPLSGAPVLRSHSLSGRSKDKIKNKIQALYRACPSSQFTFLTLSFINSVSDLDGKKCLNKFLTACRKHFGKFLYLWVAERQTDTGNIHFHLITNKRFDIAKFNGLWVLQQYNAGISHAAYTIEEIRAHHNAGTMQEILNPFDIKKIKSIEGLSIYLTMYVTKNKDVFEVANWHCCRNVSKLFTTALCSQETFAELQTSKNISVNTNTGEVYEAKTVVTDHAIIVNVLNKRHFAKYLGEVDELNRWIIKGMPSARVPAISYMDYEFIYNNKAHKADSSVQLHWAKPAERQVYSMDNSAMVHELISQLQISKN